jgi:hypothetical protein
VPCLRRATAVNYTDADEEGEKLMSFLDEVSARSQSTSTSLMTEAENMLIGQAEEALGPDGKTKGGDEDWVATHIGRGEYGHLHLRASLYPLHHRHRCLDGVIYLSEWVRLACDSLLNRFYLLPL